MTVTIYCRYHTDCDNILQISHWLWQYKLPSLWLYWKNVTQERMYARGHDKRNIWVVCRGKERHFDLSSRAAFEWNRMGLMDSFGSVWKPLATSFQSIYSSAYYDDSWIMTWEPYERCDLVWGTSLRCTCRYWGNPRKSLGSLASTLV